MCGCGWGEGEALITLHYSVIVFHHMNDWSHWYGVFLSVRFLRTKNAGFIAPLVPITFVVGYLADMAWGNKMERIVGKLGTIDVLINLL